jgi:hypothetical protein
LRKSDLTHSRAAGVAANLWRATFVSLSAFPKSRNVLKARYVIDYLLFILSGRKASVMLTSCRRQLAQRFVMALPCRVEGCQNMLTITGLLGMLRGCRVRSWLPGCRFESEAWVIVVVLLLERKSGAINACTWGTGLSLTCLCVFEFSSLQFLCRIPVVV